jgi:hypothetical protein
MQGHAQGKIPESRSSNSASSAGHAIAKIRSRRLPQLELGFHGLEIFNLKAGTYKDKKKIRDDSFVISCAYPDCFGKPTCEDPRKEFSARLKRGTSAGKLIFNVPAYLPYQTVDVHQLRRRDRGT